LEIRAARLDDTKAISKLLCELTTKFVTSEFTTEGKQALLETISAESIDKCIRAGFSYHVAETDDQLAGVVGVKGDSHLYHLFVAERFQRQGIAGKLWHVAMSESLAKGNPGEFTVNSSLYARDFYGRLGFVELSGPRSKNGVIFIPMKLKLGNRQGPCA
jgi:GNAT superfamily N-acetyltransferase